MSESIPADLERGRQKLFEVASHSMATKANAESVAQRYHGLAEQIGAIAAELATAHLWPESIAAAESSSAALAAANEARSILGSALRGTINIKAFEASQMLEPIVEARSDVDDVVDAEFRAPMDPDALSPVTRAADHVAALAKGIETYFEADAITHGWVVTVADDIEAYKEYLWPTDGL